jgi:hypothetical protein
MIAPGTPPSALIDARVKRDLCSTLRLHLSMVGIWLTDPQAAAAVDVLVARLDGEWRVRRLQPPPAGRDGGPA